MLLEIFGLLIRVFTQKLTEKTSIFLNPIQKFYMRIQNMTITLPISRLSSLNFRL